MADPAVVTSFMAITGADEAAANAMLEASAYDLEAAVNLHFAVGPAGGAQQGGPHHEVESDEAMARRLQQEGTAAGAAGDSGAPAEDEVRAPLDVYRNERLVGDDVYRPGPTRHRQAAQPTVVDAFRDFGAEAGGGGSGTAVRSATLATMYEPPKEMLFCGTFDEAKQAAQRDGRWLIVNLQRTSEFASYQLNRDTWRNDMVQALVTNNFVFFQVYDVGEEGQKLQNFYRLYELPALLIVDPVTGAPMRQWTGFVNAERLTEELLPFMEHGIHDPAASRLARRAHNRKDGSSAAGAAAAASAGQARPPQASQQLDGDEELQRALQMSMAHAGGGGAAGDASGLSGRQGSGAVGLDGGSEMEEEEEDEAAATAAGGAVPAQSAAEVQAAAAARLPQEPSDGSGCRIAVRLPDGRRLQRRFPTGSPVAAAYDLFLSLCQEAAEGRRFSLSQAVPGAPVLEDQQQAMKEAGLSGSMLVLKWLD
ncbi:hypothetical protein D9Q98_009957 [Chlorella vulgaris]|uniref:UBX domain-containing protein n=1 Tax=Chlorella vulgaris TaxID=3077 RepID=A0A9D4YSZ0_CHLVU|nr:hypothetical protein D9Q98_009957 [Chlorella vulgaris]